MQNISDAELIKRAKNKRVNPGAGAEAVGELYDRYQESIFRYIWSRVSNLQLAEDLTGEVFTRMVVSLPGYRSTGAPFQAWLYSIARNLVIDSYRKSSAQNPLPIEEAADISTDEAGPAQTVEDRIFIDQIQNALQELTPYRKDVLVLRFIVGLPLQEVASILGKTIGSIKVTQHRALNDIRAILGSNSGEER